MGTFRPIAVSALALVLASAAFLATPLPAHAADPPASVSVTFVARTCAAYADIMANKARNNIQESLFDLGPNSTYASNGIVDPTAEQTGTPGCAPLNGWRFATGRGIQSRSPTTQNLSTVTGPFGVEPETQASTPLLDRNGDPVRDGTGAVRTIPGAVTISLTGDILAWAQSGRSVWVQGGTAAQALNGRTDLGFGALRCAQDALNGDNVDQVTFPAASRHVFCYYYAVAPPPPGGTITVVKHVTGSRSGTFGFTGNISYNPGGAFALAARPGADGAISFIRGATIGSLTNPPWTFTEDASPGWQAPTPAVCTSRTGQSVITTATATTTVNLAPSDDVVCTYTNTPTPLGQGVLAKRTLGGTGSFPFAITSPNSTEGFVATTTAVNTPTTFATRVGAPSGAYTATEQLPTAPSITGPGTWSLTAAECNGGAIPFTNATGTNPPTATAAYTAAPGSDVACLFTNTFAPSGSIGIRKTSIGGTDTFRYRVLDSAASPGLIAERDITTTTAGTPIDATPVTGLSAAPDTRYRVQEFLPAPDADGFWVVDAVDCGAGTRAANLPDASVEIVLSPDAPNAVCSFTNRFQRFGSFDLVKTTTSDRSLRPGAAVVSFRCDDGSTGDVTVPSGTSTASLGALQIDTALTCTVTEPSTGAAAGVAARVSATISVDGGAPTAYTIGAPFRAELGRITVISVSNDLARGDDPAVSGAGQLAPTGLDPAPMVAVALALLLGGLCSLVVIHRQRMRIELRRRL